MANQTLNVKIQIRNDTANAWKTNDPVMLKGEMGVEMSLTMQVRKLRL